MAMYVPITGTGSQEEPYRPNVGEHVDWRAIIPTYMGGGKRGQPICAYALIHIGNKKAKRVKSTPSEEVDETTKLVTTAMQAMRNPETVERMADKDNDNTPQACFEGAQKERHRNKIDNSIIHRRRWARLLVRLCRRGFPIEKARHIITKHGIDRDEHNRGTQTSESGTRTTQPGGQQDATAGGTRE